MTVPASDLAVGNRRRARELAGRLGPLLRHQIGGDWLSSASGRRFEVISPCDGASYLAAAAGGSEEVDRAARAAAAAFPAWRDTPAAERRRILLRAADLIEEHAEEIALLEVLDTGQTIRFMSQAAKRGAENFRFFADRAEGAGDGLALPAPGFLNYTRRQPLGPVAVITPWNTPFMLSTWKIAPALAAGCTVVHKPAEWSPLSATRLHELLLAAGLPPGVCNLVHGLGESAGRLLTEHRSIRGVAFVGESATGAAIMAQGAPTLKRVHFELGGKNPVVVFRDCDLERAVDATIFMIYSLNGERCTSGSRVLVERPIYEEFCDRIARRLPRLRVGDPFDPATDLGPLIHPVHLAKVTGYLRLAEEEGARVVSGVAGPEGLTVAPTLIRDADATMRAAREEIFGPVLTAIPFDEEADALAMANDSEYGLAAYLWTGDVARAHRFAQALEVGMVWVNSHNVRHLPTPFGGMKGSGIGRDGGDWSFDFYMETQNIAVALGDHHIPRLGD